MLWWIEIVKGLAVAIGAIWITRLLNKKDDKHHEYKSKFDELDERFNQVDLILNDLKSKQSHDYNNVRQLMEIHEKELEKVTLSMETMFRELQSSVSKLSDKVSDLTTGVKVLENIVKPIEALSKEVNTLSVKIEGISKQRNIL